MDTTLLNTDIADGTIVSSYADITMDEFVALVEANPDIHFKFNAAGDVVVMSPSNIHAIVQAIIAIELGNWLSRDALPGFWASTEGAYELDGWNSRPDVAIVPYLGKLIPREAPRMAVEIRSDSNTWRELRAKAGRYLQHGTQMVWLVDTDARSVEVHRADAGVTVFADTDVIEGGDVLPRFQVMVGDLFPH